MEKTDEKDKTIIGTTFFKKYYVTEKLGQGSFGILYKVSYKGQLYAMKMEKNGEEDQFLEYETKVLTHLKGC